MDAIQASEEKRRVVLKADSCDLKGLAMNFISYCNQCDATYFDVIKERLVKFLKTLTKSLIAENFLP